jgi:hypothetical protein
MFQISKINSNAIGLIGWRQSIDSSHPVVDATNLATSSGAYFQDFSALLTVDNIKQAQNYAGISDAQINTMLGDIVKSAFIKVLNVVFSENDFLENKILYPFENSWNNKLDNDVSFVGFELCQPSRMDLIHVLNNIVLSFDAVGSVKILLFHSSRKQPILTKSITTVQDSDVDTVLNWTLSKEYNGGKFYIGYLRSGLVPKAYNREWDEANVKACFNTIKIDPIYVTGWNAETLFDVEDIEYSDKTYGLNFNITAWKDYTNVIVQNKYKFVNALGLQVAVDTLDLMLKSMRSNRTERIAESKLLFELEGIISEDLPKVAGLKVKLQQELNSLKANFIETPIISRGTL